MTADVQIVDSPRPGFSVADPGLLLGLSIESVRERAIGGGLVATKLPDGRWWIDAESALEHHRQRRDRLRSHRFSLTAEEAAGRLGVSHEHVTALARKGRLAGVLAHGGWRIDPDSVRAWAIRRQKGPNRGGHIDATPLLQLIDGRGGPAACGVVAGSGEEQTLVRARRSGTVSRYAADELVVRLLGLTPWEVWPGDW